jgi:hypothetical protein
VMQTFDQVRFEAFALLLARPDPEDLPRRSHVYRCEGDPDRRVKRMPALMMTWLQQRYLESDFEEPLAPATRMVKRPRRLVNSGLRVLRPTGTG